MSMTRKHGIEYNSSEEQGCHPHKKCTTRNTRRTTVDLHHHLTFLAELETEGVITGIHDDLMFADRPGCSR